VPRRLDWQNVARPSSGYRVQPVERHVCSFSNISQSSAADKEPATALAFLLVTAASFITVDAVKYSLQHECFNVICYRGGMGMV